MSRKKRRLLSLKGPAWMLTVEQACANWLAGRHGLRKSAKAAYRDGLQPVRDRCGEMPIQALAGGTMSSHLDDCFLRSPCQD